MKKHIEYDDFGEYEECLDDIMDFGTSSRTVEICGGKDCCRVTAAED